MEWNWIQLNEKGTKSGFKNLIAKFAFTISDQFIEQNNNNNYNNDIQLTQAYTKRTSITWIFLEFNGSE